MDVYEQIEAIIAAKYGKVCKENRKDIGDFMLNENHAVNVKSNNVAKKNYSPNMISIQKMYKWVFEQRNNLSFIFVDYEVNGTDLKILSESDPIPIEKISWNCLTIEAQGYGVIQKFRPLEIIAEQTKCGFYKGFLTGYAKYMGKERLKHEKFSRTFIKDPESIDW